jgi:hypothetical protein
MYYSNSTFTLMVPTRSENPPCSLSLVERRYEYRWAGGARRAGQECKQEVACLQVLRTSTAGFAHGEYLP